MESFKLKAIEHLEIAIRNDQEHIPSILTLCEIYREIGEYKKSQTLLNQALTCCKENCELHYQQAKLYHQLNDFENALTSIDYAIDLKPEEAKLYEFAHKILADNQKDHSAISYLEKLIDLEPLNGKAHYDLSKLLTDSNDQPKKKLLLEITIELLPSFIPAIIDLAHMHLLPQQENDDVLLWNPNIKEAERLLKSVLKINPDFGYSWHLLGELYLKLGAGEKAEKHFLKAYKFEETKGRSAYQLGLKNLKRKSYQDAKSYLLESVKLNFEKSACLYQISKILEIEKTDYKNILEVLQEASGSAEEEEKIEYDQANIYSESSNFILARKHLKHALLKKKLHSNILVRIYQITKNQNLPQNEETILSKANKLDPSNYMPFYELGINYLKDGRIDDAKIKFSSACENKWDHIESHLELGKIEHEQGNNEQAIMHFKIVLDLNNSHKIAKKYLLRMAH
ncbi:MAG: tetratricopeptide repeat protein [Opitutales bacterium]